MDIPGHCTNLDALETDDDDAGLAFLWQMIYEGVDDRLRFTAPEVAKVIEYDEDADDELPHWIAEKVTRTNGMGGLGLTDVTRLRHALGLTFRNHQRKVTGSTGSRGTPARPAATCGPGVWKGWSDVCAHTGKSAVRYRSVPPIPPIPPVRTGNRGNQGNASAPKHQNPGVRAHFPRLMDTKARSHDHDPTPLALPLRAPTCRPGQWIDRGDYAGKTWQARKDYFDVLACLQLRVCAICSETLAAGRSWTPASHACDMRPMQPRVLPVRPRPERRSSQRGRE